MLYGQLDTLRAQAQDRLATALHYTPGGTPQNRSERDSASVLYTDQVVEFGALEHGLCFGRLDLDDGTVRHIGRIGLFDAGGEHAQLLMDWRAPAARSFYLATAAAPDGVRRRRHIRTQGRWVTELDDEVLDLAEAAREDTEVGIASEAALFAALDARRTGRMRDIVETIQAEQDVIIRSDMGGVLVVQGGPGTGKTAVALHRAAYLLYTHREQLSRHGVLIIGPNPTFLRYISQVLPSLAETGVLLRTPGGLFPGVTATAAEPAHVAEVKGRLVLAEVLAGAVADRQRVPDEPIELTYDREPLWLDPVTCDRARTRALGTGRPHNLARAVFTDDVLDALVRQAADRIGADPLGGDNLLGPADLVEIREELAADPEVAATLEELWPDLTPERLLAEFYADRDRIDIAAGDLLTPSERLSLYRPGGGWTPADVPLLDEAAELLGEEEVVEVAGPAVDADYAEGVLDIALGSRSIDLEDELDPELLLAADVVNAGQLAERQEDAERLTAAQRAAADRTWAFGHIIVDEAQELSPMTWRLLMRRSPNRSMTLVGDVAQTGDLAGTASWQGALGGYVAERWRLAELTVSYRTPAEIMAVAADVLAELDPALTAPRPVRSVGVEPWVEQTGDLAGRVAALVAEEGAHGRVGVIVPESRVELRAVGGRDQVLTVRDAKGLEFDSVLIVDPQAILDESPRGHNDLYVALTRSTRRLGVLCPGEVPEVLRALKPR
ncbi:ATP-binding domain-containing protein [Longispora sp. NPDC051575]|uniref:HelD family protein n=1 Tax=Longispora sp. NPDC051575 TaxID=3154943 RepID=UPI003424D24A